MSNSDAIAQLGQRLIAAGLTERALRTCFGVAAVAHLPRALAQRPPVAAGQEPTAAALPLWLFCAGRAVRADAARAALGLDLERLIELGLVARAGADVIARRALVPIGPSIAVCDRLDATDVTDPVLWPDDSSHHLVGALPLSRAARWLDVGTGCGFAPLAAPGRASVVRASDLSERAVTATQLGANLSAADHVTALRADLVAGAGAGWDLVTFNAPIPAEAGATAATDPGHRRSPAGSAVLERFWAAVPGAIAEAGEVIVHSWVPADPLAPVAGLDGAVVVLRYASAPGFAITAWRPGARKGRAVVEVTLTTAQPHVVRVEVDRGFDRAASNPA